MSNPVKLIRLPELVPWQETDLSATVRSIKAASKVTLWLKSVLWDLAGLAARSIRN